MELLNLAESKLTPRVNFDFSTGTLDITGKSIPEDAPGFYSTIMDAVIRYEQSPQAVTTLNFALVYFNTSSSKCLLKLLTTFSAMNKRLTKVKVNWSYDVDDEDQLETANDLESSSGLEFNYIGVDIDS